MNPTKSANSAASTSSANKFASTVRPATDHATPSAAPRPTASGGSPANAPAGRPATAATYFGGAAAPSSANRPAPEAKAAAPATSTPAVRPAAAASATRPTGATYDYRANVDRQSREQKSVGNILAYFVYGLLAVFIVSGGLAIYGAVVIFDKLHDQSTSISSLDDKYAAKVAGLDKQLLATQDTLAQAQAQISRQQDLINKEQEDLNKLLAQVSADSEALRAERQARAQETATLRARFRDLDYRVTELTPKQQ